MSQIGTGNVFYQSSDPDSWMSIEIAYRFSRSLMLAFVLALAVGVAKQSNCR